MKWQTRLMIIMTFLISIVLISCANDANKNIVETISPPKYMNKKAKPEFVEQAITLSAIGDILIHSRVYDDAKVASQYDFMPMLEQVKPYLNDTTITFANQETMIGGAELGLSTYPTFSSPYEVGDALKAVGVNIVSLANNHTLDRGEAVIQSAIDHWEAIDMMYTGAYKDEADRDSLRVFETDEGISVAFLAYTYGTNGIPVPKGKEFLVNLIDREEMMADVAEARSKADVTILSLHFGNEYERMPSEEQKDLVQFAADLGVHAILGHHPHVLQPVEWVTGVEGNKTFVAYSLGNFLSGQNGLYRQIGGVVKFTIHKTLKGEEETIEITSPEFMPTYVDFQDDTNYKVIPMYMLTNAELANADAHYQEIKSHMSQWMPELNFIEE